MSRGGWLRQIGATGDAHQRRRTAMQFRRKPARSGAIRRLSVTVGGQGVEGKEVGEEARCTGARERKTGERGTALGDAFLWRLNGATGRKRAGGSGLARSQVKGGGGSGRRGALTSGDPVGSGEDATEAGNSQAARSCGSRGWGGIDNWAAATVPGGGTG
jgi:hypothetical protein